MLSLILAGSVSAVAAISGHVCKTIRNRDKAKSLNRMADLLKDCPPDECETVAQAIANVADSLFPQPGLSLPVRASRHRHHQAIEPQVEDGGSRFSTGSSDEP